MNPSPELMIGETDALNASQRTQRVTQTLYDLENSGSFKESGGKVIDQQDEMTNTFSGEVVTAVRTTAFDPLGEGKDAYVAQLLAVPSGYVMWVCRRRRNNHLPENIRCDTENADLAYYNCRISAI